MTHELVNTSNNCLYCGQPLPLHHHPTLRRHKKCKDKWRNELNRQGTSWNEYQHDCSSKRWKNMSEEEKEQNRTRIRNYTKRLRQEVIDHYGGVCECCGESRIEFLAIDHIKGNGNQHRKEVKGGTPMLKWIKRNNFPDGLRLLCHNCNMSIGMYGYCPHTAGNADHIAAINIAARAVEVNQRIVACNEVKAVIGIEMEHSYKPLSGAFDMPPISNRG